MAPDFSPGVIVEISSVLLWLIKKKLSAFPLHLTLHSSTIENNQVFSNDCLIQLHCYGGAGNSLFFQPFSYIPQGNTH